MASRTLSLLMLLAPLAASSQAPPNIPCQDVNGIKQCTRTAWPDLEKCKALEREGQMMDGDITRNTEKLYSNCWRKYCFSEVGRREYRQAKYLMDRDPVTSPSPTPTALTTVPPDSGDILFVYVKDLGIDGVSPELVGDCKLSSPLLGIIMHVTCPIHNRTTLASPEVESSLKNYGITFGGCHTNLSSPNAVHSECNFDVDLLKMMDYLSQLDKLYKAKLLDDLANHQRGGTEGAMKIPGNENYWARKHTSSTSVYYLDGYKAVATPTSVASLKDSDSNAAQQDTEPSNLERIKAAEKGLSSEISALNRTILAIVLVAVLFLIYI